ncbi:unnamed protein product [Danaus chrysippus]|uniref:(African queen) hypothetical protein n=1 Tax=Danaus chrysippus TaxID=151541 RepID=A0A8J2W0R3_9NEOP|nr:unnamed protein product [Danaus chrysippus]
MSPRAHFLHTYKRKHSYHILDSSLKSLLAAGKLEVLHIEWRGPGVLHLEASPLQRSLILRFTAHYMTSVQHSVLLKFFKDTTNMSERKEGIESRVPKEQEIRGDKEIQEEIARAGEVEMKEFSQEPVIKVTREESSFIKGDLKVEKLRVTENIAVRYQHLFKKTDTPGKTVVTQNGTTKIISVTETSEPNEEQILYREMTTMKAEYDEQRREGFQRAVHRVTKIPQFKFKHTVDKIKKQEEMIKEGKDEANLALRVVEVVQETKNDRKHLQEQQNDKMQSPNMEDEFDKIYDEICDGPQSGNFTTPEKIEDLDKLENKFEEIMNDYDKQREQKEQAGSGRVRSKIPLMKRKSEQDIDVSKSTFRRNSLKRLSSVDDAKNIICKIPEPVVRERRKQEESIQNNTVTSLNSDTVVQTETVSVKTFTLARKVATSASETISTQKSHEIVQGIENDLITHRDLTGSRIPKHFKNINGKETKMQATEIKSESRTEKINEDMKINRNETKEMKTTTIKDYTITLNIKDNISKVETKPIIIENVKILGNNDEKTQKDFQQTTADKQSHIDNNIQQGTTSVEVTSPIITTTIKEDNNNNVVSNKHVTDLDSKTSQEEDSTNTVVEEQTNNNSDIKETSSLSTLECDKENTLDTRKEDLDQSISRTTHTNIQENELKETVNVVTLEFPKALVSESQNVSNDYRSQVLNTSNDISEITEFEILRTGAEIKYKGDVENGTYRR